MEIKIKSLKFDADQKLVAFVEKKVSKLEKFYDGLGTADVILSLLPEPENKNAKIQVHVPGQELIVEKNAKTFEDAIAECADAMKEKLTRYKEKLYQAADEFTKKSDKPYITQMSLGYCMGKVNTVEELEAFLTKADAAMYEEKVSLKANR